MLRLKVLIIDDSPVVREMLTDAFQAEGFRVLEAGNGEDALKIAWKDHPDLIIADIKMPGIDGWEVCRQIRKHPYTSFIPFIFLTEKREVTDRIKGLEMGADDYMTKPFESGELLARAKAIFHRMLKREEEKIIQAKGLRGSTQMMDLADLLQLFGINNKTGVLKATHASGQIGRVGFVAGKLTSSQLGNLTGVKAIHRMLRWEEANFEVEPLLDESRESDFPDSIQEVMINAHEEKDEIKKLQRELPINYYIERSEKEPGAEALSELGKSILTGLQEKGGFRIEEVLDWFPDPDIRIYQEIMRLVNKNLIKVGNG